jgi:V8-like Glu-specific endopeptidase
MYGIPAVGRKGLLGLVVVLVMVSGPLPTRADALPGGAVPIPGPTAVIYGTDDRRPVGDSTRFPHSAIGLVKVETESDVFVGTGVMIGRFLALTCGHVVAGSHTRGAHDIEFIPAKNGGVEPFGRVKVVRVIPAPQWAASADDDYDIAILVLETAVGDDTGYFQIAVQPAPFFDNVALTTVGYPTDMGTIYPYIVYGRSYGMDDNIIIHDLDSEPGQSGSPIWFGGLDPSARLVGLLEGSYIKMGSTKGIAARIDQQTANWIEQYLAVYYDNAQGIAGSVTDDPPSASSSACGLGSLQALAAATFTWSAALVTRRRRMW